MQANPQHSALPVDTAAASDTLTQEDFDRAQTAGAAIKARVMANPISRAAYERATAEIEAHQAPTKDECV
jgi:hypothetical protein